jgi:acyl carrier protein phosphodiesterase
MNEKIRQLAEQAGIGFTLWDDSGREMIDNYTPEECLEKFAELIVRECMTICKEHPSRIVSNNWVADAVAPDIVSQFEENFGVEE